MDESLKRVEPIITSFEKEAHALINLSLNLSYYEKMDFVRRSHMAKEMMMYFDEELDIKFKFFKQMLAYNRFSPKMKVLIKFLQGRHRNCRVIMTKAENLV